MGWRAAWVAQFFRVVKSAAWRAIDVFQRWRRNVRVRSPAFCVDSAATLFEDSAAFQI
jgi:hypothetical protein